MSGDPVDNRGFDTVPGTPKGEYTDGKSESWGSQDSPYRFDQDLEIKYDSLPKDGELEKAPWAANYWPTYQDNINFRWDGDDSQSPAEKFEQAMGLSGIEDAVSTWHGIDSQSRRTECSTDDECKEELVEKCSKRRGAETGYCIPTWFGICHAWAPVALMVDEPKNPVTHNDVEFKINDIKALVTLAHNRVDSRFVSLRCNTNPDDIEYDDDGRPTSAECRYTNPATYHILLANYLGIKKKSFVEDRTFSAEVWNQPIRGFKINSEREVTIEEANELIGVQPDNVAKNTEAGTVTAGEWKSFGPYPVNGGDSINVSMTGTNDADLYVRLDAEATAAEYDCRPYSNNSVETCNLKASADSNSVYIAVKGYSDTADFEIKTESGAVASTYKFNAHAAKLQYVNTTVSWITESPSHVDGYLGDTIDTYTKTDTYEYILEIDADGNLIGGEWVGASKSDHPDFLWLPEDSIPAHTTVAGGKIKWSDVKVIYEKSLDPEAPMPAIELPEGQWQGNGSLISFTAGTLKGYGLDKDVSRAHKESASPIAFFQWEIDSADGQRLEIAGGSHATITYGSWANRAQDRVYKNVALPFVLDPAKDMKSVDDGAFYVVAVQYVSGPESTHNISATTTDAAASDATSEAAGPIAVDGHTWHGNASVISHTSGAGTGYGLNYDIAQIHPEGGDTNPVVFFQWEVSAADGKTLEISADGMNSATITYGTWSKRDGDTTKTVDLPYTIDPVADGKTAKDGDWYVIKVAFPSKPAETTRVWAKTPNANP